jgi:hypothetical protein
VTTDPAAPQACPAPPELSLPNVRLHGSVDETMLSAWIDQTSALTPDAPLVLELTTTGGDAEVARRIADDVRLLRVQGGRRTMMIGKTAVYSAGVTIMGGFDIADRWLSRDAVLLIHGRKLTKSLCIDGPLRSERSRVEALLAEIDDGLRLEEAEFSRLLQGSAVSLKELEERIIGDWYLTADQALERRLIAGVV